LQLPGHDQRRDPNEQLGKGVKPKRDGTEAISMSA
jgi:hypothetical protein